MRKYLVTWATTDTMETDAKIRLLNGDNELIVNFLNGLTNTRADEVKQGCVILTEPYIEWAALCEPFQTRVDADFIQRDGPAIWAKAKVLNIAAPDILICEIRGLGDAVVVEDIEFDGKIGDTIYLSGSLSIDYSLHGGVDQWTIPYDPELG
ncbi:hypothetical protein [Feifania hominis]|nr:hypothetical protein [Feifania hominis]